MLLRDLSQEFKSSHIRNGEFNKTPEAQRHKNRFWNSFNEHVVDCQSKSQQNQTYNLVERFNSRQIKNQTGTEGNTAAEQIVPSDCVCHCWAQIYPCKPNPFVFHDTESKRNNRILLRFTCKFMLNMKWDLHQKTWTCGISITHAITTCRTGPNFYLQMTND